MPFGFVYGICIGVWVVFACAVWIAALAISVSPRGRKYARPIALAMAMTFPSVFAFQLLIFPVALFIIFIAAFASGVIEPPVADTLQNGWAISILIVAILIAGALGLVASVLGFVDGWTVGWHVANRVRFKEAISRTKVIKRLVAVFVMMRHRVRRSFA